MSLKDRLEDDYRQAFKAKETDVMASLRMLKAAVKNAEIEARHDFEDDQVLAVIGKESKKIKDSITAFKEGKRDDLAKAEETQLAIIQKYLPAQLNEAELKDIVSDVIERLKVTEPSGFGQVMKEVMTVTRGQADGNDVKKLVQELLSNKET